MRSNRFPVALAIAVTMLVSAPVANAASVYVNIFAGSSESGLVGPAGGLGETWNQTDGTSASGLLDSTGAAGTVGFTTTRLDGPWNWSNPSLSMIHGGRARFSTSSIAPPQKLVINGLTVGAQYDVWIASANTLGSQRSQGEWTMVNPTASASVQTVDNTGSINGDTWELGNNYVLFENVVADNVGEIALTGHPRRDNPYDTRLPLNGFQIVEDTSVPPPESLTYLNVNIIVPGAPESGLVGPAGGFGETWNQVSGTSESGLLDSDGAVTSAGYTSTNLHGPWSWSNPDLGLLTAGRANFDTGANNSQEFTITGLAEGDVFDLWLASVNTLGSQRSQGEWTLVNPTTSAMVQTVDNTANINGDTWELGNNYLLFENVVVDANGEIVLTGHARRDNPYDTRLPINGFQLTRIATVVIPEPTTFLIWALGLLGLIGRRRRRTK